MGEDTGTRATGPSPPRSSLVLAPNKRFKQEGVEISFAFPKRPPAGGARGRVDQLDHCITRHQAINYWNLKGGGEKGRVIVLFFTQEECFYQILSCI